MFIEYLIPDISGRGNGSEGDEGRVNSNAGDLGRIQRPQPVQESSKSLDSCSRRNDEAEASSEAGIRHERHAA
jgi:hypothetical protein